MLFIYFFLAFLDYCLSLEDIKLHLNILIQIGLPLDLSELVRLCCVIQVSNPV